MSTEPVSLDDLLLRIALGERAAFERFYHATRSRVWAVCLRLLRVRGLAEEAMQDIYVKVWTRAAGFRPDCGVAAAWLSRLARNHCLDMIRAGRRGDAPALESMEVEDLESGDAYGNAPDEALDPSDHAARAESARDLERCLSRLREADQGLLGTAYRDGLSHSEIAARLGQPLGTVKTRIRRALLALRACLEGA